MYKLTELGKKDVNHYLREMEEKRKEILDAHKDTSDYTALPTEDDIMMDINFFIDEDGEYCNNWGVTDNYNADYPLYLKMNIHFVEGE